MWFVLVHDNEFNQNIDLTLNINDIVYDFDVLQIEREKADLSVQVIQLSERLEEAEGGAESQVNIDFITLLIVEIGMETPLDMLNEVVTRRQALLTKLNRRINR